MKEQIRDFLLKHKMQTVEADKYISLFTDEAGRGLAGKEGPFPMIPTYINADGAIATEEPVIVIDAGGTNLRIALVSFDNKSELKIEEFRKYPMPGSYNSITADEFFGIIAGYLEEFADLSDYICFVFSFPCEITSDLDGRIISFDKEVKISGAEGRFIVKELRKAMGDRDIDNRQRIIVINDTIATLMGCIGFSVQNRCDAALGIILGTGMNIAYFQENAGILKNQKIASTLGSMAVNMEAGAFDGLPMSDFDVSVQEASDFPGTMQLEKQISGAYQGKIIFEMLKAAVAEGLFTERTKERLSGMNTLHSSDLDEFVREKSGKNLLSSVIMEEDKDTALELIDAYYERAAQFMAIAVMGAMRLATGNAAEGHKVCLTLDGSAFYKGMLFKPKFIKALEEINRSYGYDYVFCKVEDGNISGGAAAVLINKFK